MSKKNIILLIIVVVVIGILLFIYQSGFLFNKNANYGLEINNNSLRSSRRKNVFENSVKILELCRQHNIPVLISSDAHYMTDIANFDNVEKVLETVNFPEELVINNSAEKFREFIKRNREREKI